MWTVDELFKNTLKQTPDRIAVVDPISNRRFSYAELDEKVDRIAAGLQSFGVEKGDRVGMSLPNTPKHVFISLAVQRIGAVAVPFDFRINDDKLRYFVSDADPKLLIFGAPIAEQVMDLRDELRCDTFVTTADISTPDVETYESLMKETRTTVTESVEQDDLSVIQYSSGTTGKPKGIEITHRVSTNRVFLNIHSQRTYDDDTILGEIPLYHTIGFHAGLLSMVATGGTYVPIPKFDPELCRRVIAEEDVTVLHQVPVMYKQLLQLQDESELEDGNTSVFESVNIVTSSAAPMSEELFEDIKRVIDPTYLYNTYGMSEIFPPYTKANLRERDDPQIFAHTETTDDMRIVGIGTRDPTATVETGEEGELIVRDDSPGAFDGYWNDYESADDAFEGDWYFTSDACVETKDGYYVITGRIDDRIKFVGENIYPANVEAVLTSYPAVESASVVGVEDDEWGEVPKAYVVANGDLTVDELEEHCVESDALEDFKRPREFEFVAEMPDAGPL